MRTPLTLASALSTLVLATGLLAPAGAAHAQAMVQNFDGLTCSDIGTPIPNNTGGLDWNSFFCMDGPNYANNPSGYAAGITSAANVAFNSFGSDATLSRSGGGLFSLTNGQFTAAWRDGLVITITGTRAGATVDTVTVRPSATAPTLVDLTALTNVDSVTFSAKDGTCHPRYTPCDSSSSAAQFVLDDLRYIVGPAHPITVTPSANGTMTCTPNPVPDGDNATCTATPAAGFQLASFTGCTQVGTGNTCTLRNVTAPATVSATFAAAPVAVPTLNEWALMLLGLGAAGLGACRLRRQG